MTLKEYYEISKNKKDKTLTDLLVIELYELKNKKGDNK